MKQGRKKPREEETMQRKRKSASAFFQTFYQELRHANAKIKSAALDGSEANGGGTKGKTEMEEERVAELKSISKEICLPSIDGEMQNIRRAADMDSSSGEEEDADWKAAIESTAATTNFRMILLGFTSASHFINNNSVDDGEDQTYNPKKLKHHPNKVMPTSPEN